MSEKKKKNIRKTNKKIGIFKKYNLKWVLLITFWTFLLAVTVSLVSESIMRNFDILLAFMILIVIISLGVISDIVGIAVAAASEKPFHSMSANKMKEGEYAVKMVRNAGPVSNFCNDVIGDIAGIISGAAGAIIVSKLIIRYGITNGSIISVIMSGFIASLTVGGKGIGKELAIRNAREIVYYTSKVFMVLDVKFGIKILPNLKKKRKRKVED